MLPTNVPAARGDHNCQAGEQVTEVPARQFMEWF
jgi:hypothetical protein